MRPRPTCHIQYLRNPKGPFHADEASLFSTSDFNLLLPSTAAGTYSVTVCQIGETPPAPVLGFWGHAAPSLGHLEHTLPSIPVLLVLVLAQDSSSLTFHSTASSGHQSFISAHRQQLEGSGHAMPYWVTSPCDRHRARRNPLVPNGFWLFG